MPANAPGALPRASLAEWIALAALAALAVSIYGWIAIDPGSVGFSDSADYLFFADYYRNQLLGKTSFFSVEFYRSTRFPPLYPLILALAGGGTESLGQVHAVSFGILLAMLAVLWAWLRRETRSPALALTITALVTVLPGLFLLSLNPVSEPLAMALTWLTFLLATRQHLDTRTCLIIGLVAGISTLARSINVALVVAVPAWLFFQRAPLRAKVAGSLAAWLPFVAWLVYRQSLPYVESYLHGLKPDYMIEQLGGWPQLLYVHPWALLSGVARNLDHTTGALAIACAIVIVVLALVGWGRRLRERKLDAIFTACYGGILLVWPFPSEAPRFMTFLYPLLLLYAAVGAATIAQGLERPWRPAASAVMLTCLVVIGSASSWWHFVDLASQPLEAELAAEKRTQIYLHNPDREMAAKTAEGNVRMRYAIREALRQIPPGDCVYATLPYLLQLHGPVRAYFYPKKIDEEVPPQDQLGGCNYHFVVGVFGLEADHPPFFPLNALEGWTHPLVIAQFDGNKLIAALLVRLPDAESSEEGQSEAVLPEAESHALDAELDDGP